MEKPELFILTSEALGAADAYDIEDTFDEMERMKIAKYPAERIAIAVDPQIQLNNFFRNLEVVGPEKIKKYKEFIQKNPHTWVLIDVTFNPVDLTAYFRLGYINIKTFDYFINPNVLDPRVATNPRMEIFVAFTRALIVLLATRNVEKQRVQNTSRSPSAKNRKASKGFAYTTTIRIGQITKSYGSTDGTGGPKRPHLRRGHVRHQRIGEGRKETKMIFIPPVFVNADKGWIESQRKAYVLKA